MPQMLLRHITQDGYVRVQIAQIDSQVDALSRGPEPILPMKLRDLHAFAGLARTVFMEARGTHGCSIDLPTEGGRPTMDQLMSIVASGEYAVAWRHERMLALRLVPSGLPGPRRAALKPHLTTVVSGGTKVRPLHSQQQAMFVRAKSFQHFPYGQQADGISV